MPITFSQIPITFKNKTPVPDPELKLLFQVPSPRPQVWLHYETLLNVFHVPCRWSAIPTPVVLTTMNAPIRSDRLQTALPSNMATAATQSSRMASVTQNATVRSVFTTALTALPRQLSAARSMPRIATSTLRTVAATRDVTPQAVSGTAETAPHRHRNWPTAHSFLFCSFPRRGGHSTELFPPFKPVVKVRQFHTAQNND